MYRGRGFAGGRAGSNASRVMIDNRPKQLLVTGYEEKDKDDVVAQFAVCIKFIFCYCSTVCPAIHYFVSNIDINKLIGLIETNWARVHYSKTVTLGNLVVILTPLLA